MADTIREKILDNISTVLNAIKTADGYVNTIASVQKWAQQGNDLATIPCIIINAGPENTKDNPGFIVEADFTVLLDVYQIAATDTDAALNSLLGDVRKALMADYTRGGYASNTKITNVIPFETEQGNPYAGLIVSVEIKYFFKSNDATSQ